ncbi:MAG: hypothetical protein EOP92_27940, partial [Lysobacteraceae bacterium]
MATSKTATASAAKKSAPAKKSASPTKSATARKASPGTTAKKASKTASSTTPKASKAASTPAKKATAKRAASKRELIAPNGDKRLIRRDAQGRIKESDDLGASLAQDVRKAAKTAVKSGQGDRGLRRLAHVLR